MTNPIPIYNMHHDYYSEDVLFFYLENIIIKLSLKQSRGNLVSRTFRVPRESIFVKKVQKDY